MGYATNIFLEVILDPWNVVMLNDGHLDLTKQILCNICVTYMMEDFDTFVGI